MLFRFARRLLWAKALVISFVAFLLGSLSTLLSWAISAPFLGEHAGSLTDAHYLGFFWGSGLAYAGIALMTLGLGFLLRSTAGSLTVVTVLLFVIEIPLGLMAMNLIFFKSAETIELIRNFNIFLPHNLF